MCGDAGLSAHDDAGASPQGDGRAASLAGESDEAKVEPLKGKR